MKNAIRRNTILAIRNVLQDKDCDYVGMILKDYAISWQDNLCSDMSQNLLQILNEDSDDINLRELAQELGIDVGLAENELSLEEVENLLDVIDQQISSAINFTLLGYNEPTIQLDKFIEKVYMGTINPGDTVPMGEIPPGVRSYNEWNQQYLERQNLISLELEKIHLRNPDYGKSLRDHGFSPSNRPNFPSSQLVQERKTKPWENIIKKLEKIAQLLRQKRR